jgi:triacylglycerol lipase
MKKRSMKIISKVVAFILILTCILVSGAFNTYAAPGKNPIVLVHGMFSNAAVFTSIMSYLRRNYGNVQMKALNLPNANQITNANAKAISNAVDRLKQTSPSGEVDMIAHSLGGGNSFNYIKKYSAGNKIDKIVTLGGANKLAGIAAVPNGVECTSIVGTMDFIVARPLSTLQGAKMVTVNTDHITMLFNNQAHKEIVKALNNNSIPANASSGCDAQ